MEGPTCRAPSLLLRLLFTGEGEGRPVGLRPTRRAAAAGTARAGASDAGEAAADQRAPAGELGPAVATRGGGARKSGVRRRELGAGPAPRGPAWGGGRPRGRRGPTHLRRSAAWHKAVMRPAPVRAGGAVWHG